MLSYKQFLICSVLLEDGAAPQPSPSASGGGATGPAAQPPPPAPRKPHEIPSTPTKTLDERGTPLTGMGTTIGTAAYFGTRALNPAEAIADTTGSVAQQGFDEHGLKQRLSAYGGVLGALTGVAGGALGKLAGAAGQQGSIIAAAMAYDPRAAGYQAEWSASGGATGGAGRGTPGGGGTGTPGAPGAPAPGAPPTPAGATP